MEQERANFAFREGGTKKKEQERGKGSRKFDIHMFSDEEKVSNL